MVVTSYETLLADTAFFASLQWQLMVLDEGHRLKNAKGKLYGVLLHDLAVARKVLLTGTPVQNDLDELFALLALLNPTYFPSREGFRSAFAPLFAGAKATKSKKPATKTATEAAAAATALCTRILAHFLLLRTNQDVNSRLSLPLMSEIVVHLPMAPMQREVYKRIVARNRDALLQITRQHTNSRYCLATHK